MRAIAALLLTAVVALAPAVAQAQDRKWIAEAAIGPTMVFGAAGDNLGTGFNFQAGATYKVTPKYGFKVDTLISKHDVNDSITQALGVGDGNGWLWHLSGNAVMSTDMNARTSVYGIAGLGVYYRKVELTNPSAALITVCDPWIGICFPTVVPADQIVGSYTSTNFGINFGGGVNFQLNHDVGVFVEARYHYVWGKAPAPTVNPLTGGPTQNSSGNGNTQFLPIVFGVRF
jgi:opacity protein-like surface antigen